VRVSGLGGGASSSIHALLVSQSCALLMQGGSCASSLVASRANLSWWILWRCMSFWMTGTKMARLAGPIAWARAQMVSSCRNV